MRIRIATVADVDVLTEFNCRLAEETEGRKLNASIVRSGVNNGLTVGQEVDYFVAELDDQVVGQLMLTREWSDWRDGWMYWVQSVYVHADYRSQGVFRRLVDHVRDRLKTRGDVSLLRLYVEEENSAAIATYRRLGFEDPGYRVMEMGLGEK